MKLWKIPKVAGNLAIAKENPLLAKLLLIRNINTDAKAEDFLNPEKKPFIPFSVFKDNDKVLSRIENAISSQEKVLIWGDFDTDGVTSTAILFKTLKAIGCNIDKYIPNRDSENHGMNTKALVKFIAKEKVKLIITVDCGISNLEEVKFAKTFKTDVIITDHHEAPEILPEAFAIINPKAKNSLIEDLSATDIESLCNLSGAGIAFKLASELLKKYDKNDLYEEILAIAAIGTVGDIVPLQGENRHIVFSGLKALKNRANKGVSELLTNAGITDFEKINSEMIAFTVVPRLNAAGRLASADLSFNLFISDDENELKDIAEKLSALNSERQQLCCEAFERAENIIQENPTQYKNSVVICDEDAHIGIIGLSASKLVETYTKPAFVMTKRENIYRCSCRGLKGINIYEILNENKDLFLSFGGHEFAGGFAFDGNTVSFEKVRDAINNSVLEQTNGEEIKEILPIDLELSADDISMEIIETLKMLEPFGAANEKPVLAIKNLQVATFNFMGQNKNHLKLYCVDENGKSLECVKWSEPQFAGENSDKIDIAFFPEINTFNGKTSIQLLIKDYILPDKKINTSKFPKFIDCRTQAKGYDKILNIVEHSAENCGVFCELKKSTDFFISKNMPKSKIFDCENLPQNLDVLIFVDMPRSANLIKKLFNNNIKELLFLNYENEKSDIKNVISKIAGMLKYAKSALNGKTTISVIRKNSLFNNEIINQTMKLLSVCGFATIEKIGKNDEISIGAITPVSFENLSKSDEFKTLELLVAKYNKHCDMICNTSTEDLKKYLTK